MKMYQAQTNISASPEVIWDKLANAGGYPDWDPGMDHIEGRIALGEKVKFFIKINPTQAFAVKVTTFEPGKKMVFSGGMPLGLFKSERTHTLTDNGDGTTTFHTQEIFSGALLPVFGKSIPDLTENFEGFAAGLKGAAEKAA
ncbi:MAG: SRPBCC domain-containing protein [Chloroflexi bacterium]|jgi:hypothetical protein|nr:SRPBCC domain-containing protein [Chloroflexota bacterium]